MPFVASRLPERDSWAGAVKACAGRRFAAAFRGMSLAADTRDRLDLFILFIVLTAVRMPNVVFEGRFWAEEGRVFYAYAAAEPWWKALFLSHSGYLNFGANIAAVAARHLVDIAAAPRVTLAFAFLGHICPAILIVTARAPWLRSRAAIAAALLLLIGAPSNEEGWLSTLHNQFQLALCAGLILSLDIEPGVRDIFRRILLFLAPLHGMVAIFVLPLFAARAWIDRSRARLVQTLILAAGSTIQLLFFFEDTPGRASHSIKLILGTVYAKDIVLPFLGYHGGARILSRLHEALDQGVLPASAWITLAVAFLALLALIRRGPPASWWLVLGCGAVALGSYYGALNAAPSQVEPHIGGRYAFVPQVLLAWALVAVAARGPAPRNLIAGAGVIWLLVVSIGAYFTAEATFTSGPNWRDEITKWESDPSHEPVVWPGGGWTIPLPRNGP